MNRRRFFASSAAATGLPLLPALASAAADEPPGFHLGAVTYNLFKDADLETVITMLEAAGFEGVELRTTHKHGVEPSLTPEERKRVRQRFERTKVRLVGYGTTCEFHSPNAAERKEQVEIGKRFVDLAVDTGAIGIKVRPNALPKEVSQQTTIQNIASSLRELGDYAAQRKIGVWLEVHGRGTSSPTVCAAIMKAADHPGVGICWQRGTGGSGFKEDFELLKPWIQHCHLHELASPYPWRELFGSLRQANYTAYTMAEVEESKELARFLRGYKALWNELCRPCG